MSEISTPQNDSTPVAVDHPERAMDAEELRDRAAKGQTAARRMLGLRYFRGAGVPKHDTVAYIWLGLAGAPERENVAERLSVAELAAAQEAVRRLAMWGDDWCRLTKLKAGWAQWCVGLAHEVGERVGQSDHDAYVHFLLAAEQGHEVAATARDRVAERLDSEARVDALRRAVKSGSLTARLELGRRYARGLGVPQHDTLAYIWLDLAALGGVGDAGEDRGRVAKRLSPEQLSAAREVVGELGQWDPDRWDDVTGSPAAHWWRGLCHDDDKWQRGAAYQQYQLAADRGHELASVYRDRLKERMDAESIADALGDAVESGSVPARRELGRRYVRGLGVPKHATLAYVWFGLAVAGSNEDAVSERDDAASKVPPQELEAARAVVVELAQRGSLNDHSDDNDTAATHWWRGLRSEAGYGSQDNEDAYEQYQLAADKGHEVAAAYRDRLAERMGAGEIAAALRQATEAGSVSARLELGRRYARGIGVPQHDIMAYVLLALEGAASAELDQVASSLSPDERAAAREAVRELGQRETSEWFDLHNETDTWAYWWDGLCEEVGAGRSQDYKTAYARFELAAEKGHEVAAACRDRLAEPMSAERIADALQQAVQSGSVRATLKLARRFVHGVGVPQNHVTAYVLTGLAAADGAAGAADERDELASRLSPQELAAAQEVVGKLKRRDCDEWFNTSDETDAWAQWWDGLCEQLGVGCHPDAETAYAKLHLAAEQGHEVAAVHRDRLAERMSPKQIKAGRKHARQWLRKHTR